MQSGLTKDTKEEIILKKLKKEHNLRGRHHFDKKAFKEAKLKHHHHVYYFVIYNI